MKGAPVLRCEKSWCGLMAGSLLLLAAHSPQAAQPQAPASPQEENAATGWVCGVVLDEGVSFVAVAELTLQLPSGPGASEPVARVASDERGSFCLQDLAPGFYELRVAREPWPPQSSRQVEVRAGLVNRLTPIELEREPGEPRVSFAESFDGLPAVQGRGLMEQLLRKGDSASLQELTRRLMPKRGVQIDVNRLALGLEIMPLLGELLRQLERGYLPPMKTARVVYLVGELSDPRTRDVVVPALLRKLRDARTVPANPAESFPGAEGTLYVSDYAINALARLAGKDFNWKYGKSPLENQRAINNAAEWWRLEVEKARDKQRQ